MRVHTGVIKLVNDNDKLRPMDDMCVVYVTLFALAHVEIDIICFHKLGQEYYSIELPCSLQ